MRNLQNLNIMQSNYADDVAFGADNEDSNYNPSKIQRMFKIYYKQSKSTRKDQKSTTTTTATKKKKGSILRKHTHNLLWVVHSRFEMGNKKILGVCWSTQADHSLTA